MRRICKKHDDKDRIICVTILGKHQFYYQPAGTKQRLWLFATKKCSNSITTFFDRYGRNQDGCGRSMTLKEMYDKGRIHNVKLEKLMERIPGQIEYVIRENEG